MTEISKFTEMVDALVEDYQRPRFKLDKGNGEFNLRTMLKMAEWAVAQQPVKVGDRVVLKDAKVKGIESNSGWYPHRERLSVNVFDVFDIGLNGAYGYWYAMIRDDEAVAFSMPMDWMVVV